MPPRGDSSAASVSEAAISNPTSSNLDWPWLTSLNPRQLEESDIERLISTFDSNLNLEADNDVDHLKCALHLVSSALKSRDADLNEAIDHLNDKEVDKEVKDENKKLKKELREMRRENKELDKQLRRFQKAQKEGDGDEALQDLLAVEQSLAAAQNENRQMEKDLERERLLKEDLEKKINLINVEKSQLAGDVESLRDELEQARTGTNGPNAGKTNAGNDYNDDLEERKVRELEETVRMKNKQIHSLLEDIEQVEKESVTYQNKVVELRDAMAETTGQMNVMTGEYVAMKESSQHFESLIGGLQKENDRLRGLLEEMLEDKRTKEKQMDQVETEVDKRFQQMKEILQAKEASIEELRARLTRTSLMEGNEPNLADQKNAAMLSQALRERDEQVEQLQDQLTQASKEIESSAALIESLTTSKQKGGKGMVDPLQKSLIQVKGQLQRAEERAQDLSEALNEAEEAAKDKSEELSSAIAQLRAYEKGEYGLEEAVGEVRKLKRIGKTKDDKIQELTQAANQYQQQVGEVLEELNNWRSEQGLDPYDPSNNNQTGSGSIKSKQKVKQWESQKQKDRALLQVMGREIERLEEERIQLKTENRKMARQLGHKAAELGLNAEDLNSIEEYKKALKARRKGSLEAGNEADHLGIIHQSQNTIRQQKDVEAKDELIANLEKEVIDYKSRYEELLEENDDLRRGMKEIHEDVKSQDGQSDVLIHCPTLEKLVEILDARHLWGQYHPAQGLKAQISKLEGGNAELREQIRKERIENDKLASILKRQKSRLSTLENELAELKDSQLMESQPPQQSGGLKTDLKVAIPSLMVNAVNAGGGGQPVQSPGTISSTSTELVAKLNLQLIQVLNQLESKNEYCKNLKEELVEQNGHLSVFRHQLGLVYEQFATERQDKAKALDEAQKHYQALEEKYEANQAKIQEYEGHIEAFGKGEMESKFADTTRKMVIMRSNEALLIRRYKALEDSEKILRKENGHLKDDIVQVENGVIEKVGELQRIKERQSFKIESLQKALSDSVPSSALEEANSQYADLTARYRHLLEQEHAHSSNERKMEEMQLLIQGMSHEKTKLKEDLQDAKQKLISCEVMVTRMHSAAASTNGAGDETGVNVSALQDHHQLESLAKQIATLEMKELNEKQRADHADNQCKLLQAQVLQLEKRNDQVEEKFSDVAKSNLELQKTERSLRDQLMTSIAKEKFDTLNGQVENLRSRENELKIETDKLRQVADVACRQIEALEAKKANENLELEALRHEIIDLQSQTDEKSLIGKLHRQLVGFQLKDNDASNKIKQLNNKLSHAQAQLLRLQQKTDEREQWAVHVRSQAYIKCKSMLKIIQDLRRQYSGSVPLSRQEKLSEILRELKEDKRQSHVKFKMAEEKLQEAQSRAEELAVKQESMENILSTLKQGAATQQVLEWHKKLEDLRLRDLRSRRQSDRWSAEVDHLRELTSSQARKIDQLEEEIVRMENQVEQKQLDWETRQIELENLKEEETERSHQQSVAAKVGKSEYSQSPSQPNPDWPLAKQLEHSLNLCKVQSKTIEEAKTKLADTRQLADDLKRKLREAEAKILAKDKIINDLRLQMPQTVDRAYAMASVTGEHGLPVSLTTDYESKQALHIAQTTIQSLRERLEQKEETVGRYERLLRQARNEFEAELNRKQEEVISLKTSLRSQSQTIQSLRVSTRLELASNQSGGNVSQSSIIATKMQRIAELEDEVIDLQSSLGEVSKQLAIAQSDAENYKKSALIKQKEVNELKETMTIKKGSTAIDQDDHNSATRDETITELNVVQHENQMLQEEIEKLKMEVEKTPGNVMSSLVDKLRHEVQEKDKKIKALSRVIADLKTEMINNASSSMLLTPQESTTATQIDKNAGDKEEIRDLKKNVEDLECINQELNRQVESLKTKQTSAIEEIKSLREDLSKKASLLIRMREEKMNAKSSSTPTKASSTAQADREKDEMRKTILKLQGKINSLNKAEKPFEQDLDNTDQVEKQLKSAAELARWDESKKWQHKIEILKAKLSDADNEVSKLSKSNNSLRDLHCRLEREKLMLENKLKNINSGKGSVKGHITEIKMKELQVENASLREELEATRHDYVMQGSQGLETQKLRNRFLQSRIEAQERKIAALEIVKKSSGGGSGGGSADSSRLIKKLEEIQEKEKECQKLKLKIEEENMHLKLQLEKSSIMHDITKIAEVIKVLSRLSSMMRDAQNPAWALELNTVIEELSSTAPAAAESPSKSTKKNIQQLTEEINKLKSMNEELVAKVETKSKEIESLRLAKMESRSMTEVGMSAYSVPNVEEIRKMEADLKRKSDLLAEVKVLLKQAADRERAILASKDELARQLKLILEVDPKSPSEALAKELRQARLTIDRLQCEKVELEHNVSKLEQNM